MLSISWAGRCFQYNFCPMFVHECVKIKGMCGVDGVPAVEGVALPPQKLGVGWCLYWNNLRRPGPKQDLISMFIIVSLEVRRSPLSLICEHV